MTTVAVRPPLRAERLDSTPLEVAIGVPSLKHEHCEVQRVAGRRLGVTHADAKRMMRKL